MKNLISVSELQSIFLRSRERTQKTIEKYLNHSSEKKRSSNRLKDSQEDEMDL